jgi:hypothetical protein
MMDAADVPRALRTLSLIIADPLPPPHAALDHESLI